MRAVIISLFGFLVFVAIGSISFCDGKLCIESERKALLKFKNDLIDPSNMLSTWEDGEQHDCCKWVGVFCNNLTGHVHKLHLGGFVLQISLDPLTRQTEKDAYLNRPRLQGIINPSLLHLKHLSFLDLSDNDFGGMQIPEFIGSLNSLTHLDLSRANFSNSIPHQLANLSKLQYLDLGHNFLSEAKILQWVSSLSSLQYLDLSRVDLSKATDWQQVTNKLPSLVELHLLGCSLSNVPYSPVSVNHTTLAVLDLSVNMLTSVPTWIFSLSSLVSINLDWNNFVGVIPNGFKNLSSLSYLDLGDNYFFSSSSIPNWLSNLNHLQYLNLRNISLQGNITSVIGNLSSVTYLDLSSNMLKGIVPKSFESLCSLREMDLSFNEIDHEVSEIIESLSRCSLDTLELLNLKFNKFYGKLSDQLGQFENLAHLYVYGNSISGPIPFSIGKLSSLETFQIGNNKFNGSLLQILTQLKNLYYLDFSNNSFEGTISENHFSSLTRLRYFSASNNRLTFKPHPNWIPPFHCELIEIGNWHLGPQFPLWLQFQKNLSVLDLSYAGISDVIPTWFWNLSNQLVFVNLSNNHLVGGISYWPNIQQLDLSSNQFTGSLPKVSPDIEFLILSGNSFSGSLSHFVNCNASTMVVIGISVLDIGSNLLSGTIPDCWNHWYLLQALNLENNNLTGEIPRSLGFTNGHLLFLNLRSNSLFGEVPSSLQYHSTLAILDLSENQFSGSIPAWIGDKLSNLLILNLRSNNLQSELPQTICALHYLQVLDLGSNNISGVIPKCFQNLSALTDKTLYRYGPLWYNETITGNWFIVAESLYMKGREDEYSTTLGLVTMIDLSANSLTGEIPKELGNLRGLLSMNLSRNILTGKIPENIGNMESLESLDLSMNRLNREIPSSLSHLNFLSHFNLSYNNLTGQIPTGTQLQSFELFSYIGNHLCGPPVSKSCGGNGNGVVTQNNNVTNGGSKWSKVNGFSVSIVVGFVLGFWGVVAPLYFIRSWRFAYYQKLDQIGRGFTCFGPLQREHGSHEHSQFNKKNER